MSNALPIADTSPCVMTPQGPIRQQTDKPHMIVHDETPDVHFKTNLSDLLGRTYKEQNHNFNNTHKQLNFQKLKILKKCN